MKVTYFATVTVFGNGAQAATAIIDKTGEEVYLHLHALRSVRGNIPTNTFSDERLPEVGDQVVLHLASRLLRNRTLQACRWGFIDIPEAPIAMEPASGQIAPVKNVIRDTRFAADDVGEIPRHHGRQTRQAPVREDDFCDLISTKELPTTPWHAYGVRSGKGPNRPHYIHRVRCTGIAA